MDETRGDAIMVIRWRLTKRKRSVLAKNHRHRNAKSSDGYRHQRCKNSRYNCRIDYAALSIQAIGRGVGVEDELEVLVGFYGR